MDKTSIFDAREFKENLINEMIVLDLKEISLSLLEKGYDPINQIVGYLMTNDESYITSFNDARNVIRKYSKTEILSALVKGCVNRWLDIWR